MLNRISISCFIVCVMFGCSEERLRPEVDFGYDYYPLAVGSERIYKVDSTLYSLQGQTIRTSSGYVREVVREISGHENEKNTYRVERSYRKIMDDPWEVRQIILVERNSSQLIRQEANIPLLKLVFPLRQGSRWIPTSFFVGDQAVVIEGSPIDFFKGWQAEVLGEMKQLDYQGETYQDLIEIEQAGVENLIELRQVREYYARGVGLVVRELRILDTQCRRCCNGNTGDCLLTEWPEKAEQGIVVSEYLIDYQ